MSDSVGERTTVEDGHGQPSSVSIAPAPAHEVSVAMPRRPWWARLLRPAVAVPVAIAAVLVSAPLAYRSTRIAGLPLIEHPFDLEAYGTIEFDPEDNAAPLYAAAAAGLVAIETISPGADLAPDLEKALKFDARAASGPIRTWVARNRPALEAFRAATARPVYVAIQPKDVQIDSLLPQVQQLREFARLAVLEGLRCEYDGDAAEAWTWYRAAIRCSRHCGSHGTLIERLVGISMLAQVAPHAGRWAGNPTVDADLLRRATTDLQSDLALAAPASASFRSEYRFFRNTLARPDAFPGLLSLLSGGSGVLGGSGPVENVEFFLANEPEISDRVLRHVYANWLAYVDLPPWDRPSATGGRFGLFEPLPGDLPHVLPPRAIEKCLERSILAQLLLPTLEQIDHAIRRDQATAVVLRTAFAAQLVFRETGASPARIEDLVPKFLAETPRDPWDPAGAPVKLRVGPGGHLVVWSVGSDGTDDGGVADASDVRKADIALDAAPVEEPTEPNEVPGDPRSATPEARLPRY